MHNFIWKILPKDHNHDSIVSRRFWRHLYQRIIRGFDDGETWSLDYNIIKFTLPRLKRFREIVDGGFCPGSLSSEIEKKYIEKGYKFNKSKWQFENKNVREKYWKECHDTWDHILNIMIEGFEYYVNFDKYEYRLKPEVDRLNKILRKGTEKQQEELQKMFAKYGYKPLDTVSTFTLQEMKIQDALELFHKYFRGLWW